jgi:hypothetical protein
LELYRIFSDPFAAYRLGRVLSCGLVVVDPVVKHFEIQFWLKKHVSLPSMRVHLTHTHTFFGF